MWDRVSNNAWLTGCDDPWQNLANAIIAYAANDYRIALRNNDDTTKREIMMFFMSDWYNTLTSLRPSVLLEMLYEEHREYLKSKQKEKEKTR